MPKQADEYAVTLEQKVLESINVSGYVREKLSYSVEPDLVRDELIHKIETFFLAEHITDDYYWETVWHPSTPKTWWQMFKQTYSDRWWLKRHVRKHPVQFNTGSSQQVGIKVKRYVGYPDATIQIKNFGRPWPFEMVERTDYTRP